MPFVWLWKMHHMVYIKSVMLAQESPVGQKVMLCGKFGMSNIGK